MKNADYFQIMRQGARLSLSLIIMLFVAGSAKAEKLVGCYLNQDATGSYLMVLLPQGNYEYHVRTRLNQQVTSTGSWWREEQSLFTKITVTTIRDQLGVSRLVDGSVQQLRIHRNGNLVGNSKVYRPVSCSENQEMINESFLEANQHRKKLVFPGFLDYRF